MSIDSPTEVTIAGFKCLRSADARWELRVGTSPVIETFEMHPDDAIAVLEQGGPLELKFMRQEGVPLVVQNLWALNIEPSETPYISRITLADRRWFWTYKHVERNYNIPRTIGTKRVINNDQVALPFAVAPNLGFAPYSLVGGRQTWNGFSMIEDVMKEVAKAEGGFPVRYDGDLLNSIKNLPIQNVQIKHAGDAAVSIALSYLPEADVYVDYDGTVIVFSKVTGREREVIKALLPEVRGGVHTDLVKNFRLRPREVHVLFTREIETVLTFDESATTQTEEGRWMTNVLPLPDYNATVSGVTLTQGTWTPINSSLFSAWGDLPFIGTQSKMSISLLRRICMPFKDCYRAIQITGQLPDSQGALADWVGRLGACTNNFRQTFQINRRLVDFSIGIRDYRLATINPQSGQRAPAVAYGDYALLPSQKFNMRNASRGRPLYYAINKSAYPASGKLDTTADPSPGFVRIVDSDQGIIRVEYVTDPFRQFEQVLPSQIDLNAMPHGDLTRQDEAPVTFDSIISTSKRPSLSADFKLLIVLTVIPGGPNNNDQLHRVVVRPSDVASMLPSAAQEGLKEAMGPVMEIRVGPNVETARVQWLDSRVNDLEKALGIQKGTPDLTGLVINEGNSGGFYGASLTSIAKARSAALYASMADRFEGTMVGAMNPNVHISGYIDSLVQEARAGGETLTRAVMAGKTKRLDMGAFLDSNSRNAIYKLVAQEK